MAGKYSWAEARALGASFDDIDDRLVTKTAWRHYAAFIDRPE